jgi:hypothetical protein
MAGLRGAHAGASRGARLAACRADALRALWGSPLQGLRGAFDAVADAITLLFTSYSLLALALPFLVPGGTKL